LVDIIFKTHKFHRLTSGIRKGKGIKYRFDEGEKYKNPEDKHTGEQKKIRRRIYLLFQAYNLGRRCHSFSSKSLAVNQEFEMIPFILPKKNNTLRRSKTEVLEQAPFSIFII
jgi:hypothetical protein